MDYKKINKIRTLLLLVAYEENKVYLKHAFTQINTQYPIDIVKLNPIIVIGISNPFICSSQFTQDVVSMHLKDCKLQIDSGIFKQANRAENIDNSNENKDGNTSSFLNPAFKGTDEDLQYALRFFFNKTSNCHDIPLLKRITISESKFERQRGKLEDSQSRHQTQKELLEIKKNTVKRNNAFRAALLTRKSLIRISSTSQDASELASSASNDNCFARDLSRQPSFITPIPYISFYYKYLSTEKEKRVFKIQYNYEKILHLVERLRAIDQDEYIRNIMNKKAQSNQGRFYLNENLFDILEFKEINEDEGKFNQRIYMNRGRENQINSIAENKSNAILFPETKRFQLNLVNSSKKNNCFKAYKINHYDAECIIESVQSLEAYSHSRLDLREDTGEA
jgi:hypothetical protein